MQFPARTYDLQFVANCHADGHVFERPTLMLTEVSSDGADVGGVFGWTWSTCLH